MLLHAAMLLESVRQCHYHNWLLPKLKTQEACFSWGKGGGGCARRYTIVKNGSRRLFVPNSAFLTREFMVVDDPAARTAKRDLGADWQQPAGVPGFGRCALLRPGSCMCSVHKRDPAHGPRPGTADGLSRLYKAEQHIGPCRVWGQVFSAEGLIRIPLAKRCWGACQLVCCWRR